MTTPAQRANDAANHIIQSRSGGAVERCHGIRHLGSYSNARHSWGVALLMWYIWPKDFPRLAIHCLTHDVPESWTGDVPAPTTRYIPGLKNALAKAEGFLNEDIGLPDEHSLHPDDMAKLKACDRLEFWLWCREEVALGNQFAKEGLSEIERFLTEVPLPAEAEAVRVCLAKRSIIPTQAGVMKSIGERLQKEQDDERE